MSSAVHFTEVEPIGEVTRGGNSVPHWVSTHFNVQLQCIAASYTGPEKKDEKERLVHTVFGHALNYHKIPRRSCPYMYVYW